MPESAKTDTMHLCFCGDRGFWRHYSTLLGSIATHHDREDVHLHFSLPGADDRLQRYLLGLCAKLELPCTIHDISPVIDSFMHCFVSRDRPDAAQRYNYLTYGRLFLGDLMPKQIGKVIYLDLDLLICGSLRPLWNALPDGEPIAVGPNMTDCLGSLKSMMDGYIRYLKHIGVPDARADQSFNAGVMVMDLDLWREQKFGEKTLEARRQVLDAGHQLRHEDQDAMHFVFADAFELLPSQWNFLVFPARPAVDPASWEKISIYHFGGRRKPWNDHQWTLFAGPALRAYLEMRAISSELLGRERRATIWSAILLLHSHKTKGDNMRHLSDFEAFELLSAMEFFRSLDDLSQDVEALIAELEGHYDSWMWQRLEKRARGLWRDPSLRFFKAFRRGLYHANNLSFAKRWKFICFHVFWIVSNLNRRQA